MRILQNACESSRILCESCCESSGLLPTATSFSDTRWSNIDADPERIAANPPNFSPQHPRFLVQAGNPREKTILSFKWKLHDCGCIASCFFWLSAHTELLVNVRHSFLQPLRELIRRLSSHDLQGPAAVLFANGFASKDFANVDVKTLTGEIRLSIFAARKVLAARDTFLSPMGGS